MFFLIPEIGIIFNSGVCLLCIIFTWAGEFIVLVAAIIFSTGTYYDMIPIFVGVLFIFWI